MSYDRVAEKVAAALEEGEDQLTLYVVTQVHSSELAGVFLTRRRAERFVGPSTHFYAITPSRLVTG